VETCTLGTGICPLCHRKNDKHVPANCPILKDFNLKLIQGPPPPAAAPAVVPAGGTLAVAPSPGGHSAVADDASASSSSIAGIVPLGHVATVAEEYESDNDFRWEGDESGVEFISAIACKSNSNIAFYPSCNYESLRLRHPSPFTMILYSSFLLTI
jgi:hypothetical protein